MSPRIGLCFCHGWGFHPDFWSSLLPFFPDAPIKIWNLGYFGEKANPLPDTTADQWIAIGHSIGFRKLMESKIDWAGVVAVQGFYDFLGSEPRMRKVRQRALNQMQTHWNQNPQQVLQDFYNEASLPHPPSYSFSPEWLTLETDLRSLDVAGKFDWPLSLPYRVLGSRNDFIVPPSLMESEWNSPQIEWSEGGGHALGFFESDFVAESIHSLIRELRENCHL